MPSRQQTTPIEDMVAEEAERLRGIIAKGAADTLGPAPGTEKTTSDDEDLDLWDFRDPNVDPMARFTELTSQGMSSGQARTLVANELNPERLTVLQAAGDFQERIALAKRMDRASKARTEKRRKEQPQEPMRTFGGAASLDAAFKPTMGG